MKVPFVDLKTQYNSIREEVNSAITEAVENTDFVGGNRVKRFESDFASLCGGLHQAVLLRSKLNTRT
jgi:dTDP-4-amino-4,6-dideoxygalactose transaminase